MQDWIFTRERLALQEEDLGLFLDNTRAAKEVEDARQEEIRASRERGSGDSKVSGRGMPAGRARPPLNAGSGDDDEDRLEKREITADEFVTANDSRSKNKLLEVSPGGIRSFGRRPSSSRP